MKGDAGVEWWYIYIYLYVCISLLLILCHSIHFRVFPLWLFVFTRNIFQELSARLSLHLTSQPSSTRLWLDFIQNMRGLFVLEHCRAALLLLFRELLRIDGAITKPSKRTHTATEGGLNTEHYSELGFWELEIWERESFQKKEREVKQRLMVTH